MIAVSNQTPPKKKRGHRTINGAALDVRSAAALLGMTEKTLRGMIARQLVPFRRLNSRIIVLRSELEIWLQTLDGCTLDDARINMEQRR